MTKEDLAKANKLAHDINTLDQFQKVFSKKEKTEPDDIYNFLTGYVITGDLKNAIVNQIQILRNNMQSEFDKL